MNANSVICNFISLHPNDWEEELKAQYDLKIKREGDLAIFNYSYEADFYQPIVQEARGIIIDTVRLEVVCWPFRKFGNHTEGYVDEIDWNSARVLEKVELGSKRYSKGTSKKSAILRSLSALGTDLPFFQSVKVLAGIPVFFATR